MEERAVHLSYILHILKQHKFKICTSYYIIFKKYIYFKVCQNVQFFFIFSCNHKLYLQTSSHDTTYIPRVQSILYLHSTLDKSSIRSYEIKSLLTPLIKFTIFQTSRATIFTFVYNCTTVLAYNRQYQSYT